MITTNSYSNNNSQKSNSIRLVNLPMLKPEDFAKYCKGKLITIRCEWADESTGELRSTTEVFACKSVSRDSVTVTANRYLTPEERYEQYKEAGLTDGSSPVAYYTRHGIDPDDEYGFAKVYDQTGEFWLAMSRFHYRRNYMRQFNTWPEVVFATIGKKKPAADITVQEQKIAAAIVIKDAKNAAAKKPSSRR